MQAPDERSTGNDRIDSVGGTPPFDVAPEQPLCVDLDGTLLRTDLLYEALLELLFRNPVALLTLPLLLLRGIAQFKARVAALVTPDYDTLPLREPVLDLVRRHVERGGRAYLVSASPQTWVEGVAARTGLFEDALGSGPERNLKGANKGEEIRRRYGATACYVGDSTADTAVWARVEAAVVVGSPALDRAAAAVTEVRGRIPAEPVGFRALTRALRLHQWAKNGLVFIPLFMSLQVATSAAIAQTFVAFIALGVLASSTYIVNDLGDLKADRRHRSKRLRPLPSGTLPIPRALALVAAGVVTGALLAITLLPPAVGACLLAYTVLTLAYSFRLKRFALLDALVLAALFTLRLLTGAALLVDELPYWLLIFSMCFFFSLALVKRYTELASQLAGDDTTLLPGRGYCPADRPLVLALGAAAAVASSVVFAIYLINSHFSLDVYSQPNWLWLGNATIFYWLMRTWLLAIRGRMNDDPVLFAVRDPASIAMGGIVLVSILLAW